MIPVPDLLYAEPRDAPHPRLDESLEMAFLGSNETARIDAEFGELSLQASTWDPELFARDVFLEEFVDGCSPIRVAGGEHRINTRFLLRVLSHPPTDLETVRFRQGILRELEEEPGTRQRVEELYDETVYLLDRIKSAHTLKNVDDTPQRLRVLSQARRVIDTMAEGFAGCDSGLRRLHEAGASAQDTEEYRVLAELLGYENELASVSVSLGMGAAGRIKRLQIERVEEATDNRFYQLPLIRWWKRLLLYWRGYGFGARELANRVIIETYREIAPTLHRLLRVLPPLEVYLAARQFARRSREHGLEVCLPEVTGRSRREGSGGVGADPGRRPGNGPPRLRLRQLFNPLLLGHDGPPIPCDLECDSFPSITLVTGPNSGGKTRLIQGVALAQILAQSGLYVPAAEAEVPLVNGLFVSAVHGDAPDELEGRLGRELVRIRTLFRNVRPRSLILLDELCSGTNPSEATRIVRNVLRLLCEIEPRAFVITHFLELARELRGEGLEVADGRRVTADGGGSRDEPASLEFLRVEMRGEESTYQFVPGVADTSMAAETARRLGADFESLSREIRTRLDTDRAVAEPDE